MFDSVDTFDALADPTRRGILELLHRGERPAGDFTIVFPHLSQPAISRHLKVLREVGLVEVRVSGSSRLYRLRPGAFASVDAWLAPFRTPGQR